MKKLFCVILVISILSMSYISAFAYEELSKGSKGEDVVKLQERLNELNYDAGKADGSYGNGTASAVRDFQSQNRLEATGIADGKTQEKLFSDKAIKATVYEKLEYKDALRNPDDYWGNNVKFDERVLQVIEVDKKHKETKNGDEVPSYATDVLSVHTGGETTYYYNIIEHGLRVATKGSNSNVVFVYVYDNEIDGGRILEGDKIAVKGSYSGLFTGTTILGASKELLAINADSVVIK